MLKKGYSIKICAVAVSFIFTAQNVLLATQGEANFWKERRLTFQRSSKPITLASNPLLHPEEIGGPILTQGLKAPLNLPKLQEKELGQLPLWAQQAILPFAQVSDVHLSRSPQAKTVFLIQDLHLNFEAQKNIAGVLSSLGTGLQSESKRLLVALEGADSANIDFSRYSRYPRRQTMDTVARAMLRAKLLNGAEYAAIKFENKEQDGPVELPFKYIGAERWDEYRSNVRAFRELLPLKKLSEQAFFDLKRTMIELKNRYYDGLLRKYDVFNSEYEEQLIGIDEYIIFLNSISPATTPSLCRLREAVQIEKSLDLKQVEKERAQVLKDLLPKLSNSEVQRLLQASALFRAGEMTYGAFYQMLKTSMASKNIALSNFPALNQYLKYVLVCDSIDAQSLFEELPKLEEAVSQLLIKNEEQRELVELTRDFHLLKKLANQSLTEQEWLTFESRRGQINKFQDRLASLNSQTPASLRQMESHLASFESFYQWAQKRNHTMVERLTVELSSFPSHFGALVCGGFHTQGVLRGLKDAGFNVVVLSPKVAGISDEPSSLDLLGPNQLPIEKLFRGQKLFLTTPAATAHSELAPVVEGVAVAGAKAVDSATGRGEHNGLEARVVEPGPAAQGSLELLLDGENDGKAIAISPTPEAFHGIPMMVEILNRIFLFGRSAKTPAFEGWLHKIRGYLKEGDPLIKVINDFLELLSKYKYSVGMQGLRSSSQYVHLMVDNPEFEKFFAAEINGTFWFDTPQSAPAIAGGERYIDGNVRVMDLVLEWIRLFKVKAEDPDQTLLDKEIPLILGEFASQRAGVNPPTLKFQLLNDPDVKDPEKHLAFQNFVFKVGDTVYITRGELEKQAKALMTAAGKVISIRDKSAKVAFEKLDYFKVLAAHKIAIHEVLHDFGIDDQVLRDHCLGTAVPNEGSFPQYKTGQFFTLQGLLDEAQNILKNANEPRPQITQTGRQNLSPMGFVEAFYNPEGQREFVMAIQGERVGTFYNSNEHPANNPRLDPVTKGMTAIASVDKIVFAFAATSPDPKGVPQSRLGVIGNLDGSQSGKPFDRPKDEGTISVLAMGPNGILAAGSSKGQIELYGVPHAWNEPFKKLPVDKKPGNLTGHPEGGGVLAMDFNPDPNRAKMLASGGGDNLVRIWDIDTGKSQTLEGHLGPVNRVKFSRDGKLLATVDYSGFFRDYNTLRIWQVEGDVQNPKVSERMAIPINGHRVVDLDFSADNQFILGLTSEGNFLTWRAATGALLVNSQVHRSDPLRLLASPFKAGVVKTASKGGGINTWDISKIGQTPLDGKESRAAISWPRALGLVGMMILSSSMFFQPVLFWVGIILVSSIILAAVAEEIAHFARARRLGLNPRLEFFSQTGIFEVVIDAAVMGRDLEAERQVYSAGQLAFRFVLLTGLVAAAFLFLAVSPAIFSMQSLSLLAYVLIAAVVGFMSKEARMAKKPKARTPPAPSARTPQPSALQASEARQILDNLSSRPLQFLKGLAGKGVRVRNYSFDLPGESKPEIVFDSGGNILPINMADLASLTSDRGRRLEMVERLNREPSAVQSLADTLNSPKLGTITKLFVVDPSKSMKFCVDTYLINKKKGNLTLGFTGTDAEFHEKMLDYMDYLSSFERRGLAADLENARMLLTDLKEGKAQLLALNESEQSLIRELASGEFDVTSLVKVFQDKAQIVGFTPQQIVFVSDWRRLTVSRLVRDVVKIIFAMDIFVTTLEDRMQSHSVAAIQA